MTAKGEESSNSSGKFQIFPFVRLKQFFAIMIFFSVFLVVSFLFSACFFHFPFHVSLQVQGTQQTISTEVFTKQYCLGLFVSGSFLSVTPCLMCLYLTQLSFVIMWANLSLPLMLGLLLQSTGERLGNFHTHTEHWTASQSSETYDLNVSHYSARGLNSHSFNEMLLRNFKK